MGHVPARPVPEARPGDDLPRREHRGAGAAATDVGRAGEEIAARFLARRGAEVVGRNVRVGRGEIDLVVRLGGELVAVEVKTRAASAVDPIANFTPAKAAQVRGAARRMNPPAYRVDLVTVELGRYGAGIRWVQHAGAYAG